MMSEAQSQIGVYLDAFRAAPKEALHLASELGFEAVHMGAAEGPVSPQQLSASGRRHLRRFAGGLGLSIVALRADFGGLRFLDPALVDQHIDNTRRILELARELDASTVTAPIGKFRTGNAHEYDLIRQAIGHVAQYADTVDRVFAIETAVDTPDAIRELLADLSCPNLKVCYDPAELLMDGIDPLASIETFANEIALAYMRDAQRGSAAQPGRETNLGEGQLNLPTYLAQLEAAGYHGPLVVHRSQSANPLADLRACKSYLESIASSRTPR